MIKFPSIEQYRNAIRNVKQRVSYRGRDTDGQPILDLTAPIPTLKYRGTVKLHGTNAGIVRDYCNPTTDDITFQSRERILSLTQDNAGFMLYMSQHLDELRGMFDLIEDSLPEGFDASGSIATKIAIFGEWCGQGIQKGVAISDVPKMFVVFGVKVFYDDQTFDSETGETEKAFWLDDEFLQNIKNPELRIFNILDFQTYEIEIDFNFPEIAQQKMVEITEAVEKECPVGKAFGVSGIGEGVVWKPYEDLQWTSSDYWFKVKGEKHSVSKVKTLAPVDVEAAASMRDFIDRVVTEARLEQGLQWLTNEAQKPFDMTSMGEFIRWVYNDVMKEETDTIVASQLDPKKLGGPIANKSRPWFVNKLNSNMEVAA
jgi:hypothetical protein